MGNETSVSETWGSFFVMAAILTVISVVIVAGAVFLGIDLGSSHASGPMP